MKRNAKGILAAISLFVGLAGPAAAEMSDSSATDGGGSGAIDSLLKQYVGLTPGNSGGADPTTQAVSAGQRYSAFTGSAGAMTSYFTTLGVDLTSPNEPLVPQGGSVGSSSDSGSTAAGSGADLSSSGSFAAAAPAIAAGTLAHAVQVSQVGDVATSIASAASGGSGSASFTPAAVMVTTSEQPLTPAPIPPAAMLLASGLAALASLRKRNRTVLAG
jgi:hypothetical protein